MRLRCRYGGYDVLIYLRFMSLCLKIFGSFAPYALLVLLPINISASYFPARRRVASSTRVPF